MVERKSLLMKVSERNGGKSAQEYRGISRKLEGKKREPNSLSTQYNESINTERSTFSSISSLSNSTIHNTKSPDMDGRIFDGSSMTAYTIHGSEFSEERREPETSDTFFNEVFRHQRMGGVLQLTMEDLQDEVFCLFGYWLDGQCFNNTTIESYLQTHWDAVVRIQHWMGKFFIVKLNSREAICAWSLFFKLQA